MELRLPVWVSGLRSGLVASPKRRNRQGHRDPHHRRRPLRVEGRGTGTKGQVAPVVTARFGRRGGRAPRMSRMVNHPNPMGKTSQWLQRMRASGQGCGPDHHGPRTGHLPGGARLRSTGRREPRGNRPGRGQKASARATRRRSPAHTQAAGSICRAMPGCRQSCGASLIRQSLLRPENTCRHRAGLVHQALRFPVTASAGSASRLTFLAVSGSLAADLDHMSAGSRVWAQTKPLVG